MRVLWTSQIAVGGKSPNKLSPHLLFQQHASRLPGDVHGIGFIDQILQRNCQHIAGVGRSAVVAVRNGDKADS